MTIDEAIESMRLAVNEPAAVQCQMMRVLADVWREAEAAVKCEACNHANPHASPGKLYSPWEKTLAPCSLCHGAGVVSNGNAARGDALELLGECGKCGDVTEHEGSYWIVSDRNIPHAILPRGWWDACWPREVDRPNCVVRQRLKFMDAYAAADQETRERWKTDTRALSEGVT